MTADSSQSTVLKEESSLPSEPGPALAPAPEAELGSSPERFINRELSWLHFNRRVLEEAANEAHPLLERVRFLSISANNLDEFFMVRVAGLRGQVREGITFKSPDGLTPAEQLVRISEAVSVLASDQQKRWRELRQMLAEQGIVLIEGPDVTKRELSWLEELLPAADLSVADAARDRSGASVPVHSQSRLHHRAATRTRQATAGAMDALIRVPGKIERFIRLPAGEGGAVRIIPLEQLIGLFIGRLFPGYAVKGQGAFRVIRDSEIEIEEEAEDLVREFETVLKRRRRGSVIRLELDAAMPAELRRFVQRALGCSDDEVFLVRRRAGAQRTVPAHERRPSRSRIRAVQSALSRTHPRSGRRLLRGHPAEGPGGPSSLRVVRRRGAVPAAGGTRSERRRHQADPVPHVIRQSDHPDAGRGRGRGQVGDRVDRAQGSVRRGGQYPLGARPRARRRAGGLWVHRSQDACQAVAGRAARRQARSHPMSMSAPAIIIRSPRAFIPTCRSSRPIRMIARDVARVFNFITGYAEPAELEKLAVSPLTLRKRICDHIEQEIAHARNGKPAAIWMKDNAMVDPGIIDMLYKASQAGVAVDMVVRGICCLRPGIPGLSENIRVKSIVGRFLEHSRIYCFGMGHGLPHPKAAVYISSADMMPRNLDRRVEVLCPIFNPTVHEQVLDQIMVANFKDNEQSWKLLPDGSSNRIRAAEGEEPFNAHKYFMTNPSLSGRGTSLKESSPRSLTRRLDRG